MKYQIEYTDTFGGEKNYGWVKQETLHTSKNNGVNNVIRAAKKLMGLTGVRCKRREIGEQIDLYPSGSCTVLSIIPVY